VAKNRTSSFYTVGGITAGSNEAFNIKIGRVFRFESAVKEL